MNKKEQELNFISCVQYLSQYLKGLRVQIVMFYFGWLFDTVAGIISPILFGIMINQIVYYKNLNLFMKIGLVFFILSIFGCVMYYLIYELYSYIWNKLNYKVRIKLFSHMQKIDAEEMSNSNYGDMISMIQWMTMDCVHFIVRNIIHNINNILRVIVCITILFVISPIIGVVMIIMVPVSVYISWKYGKKIREESYSNKEVYGEYIGWLYEILSSLKDIRLLNAEERVRKLLLKKQGKLIKTDIKTGIATLKAENIINIINTILQMVLFFMLAVLTTKQSISIGTVVVVLAYFTQLSKSLQSISNSYMDSQNRISTIQRLRNFFDKPTTDSWEGKDELVVSKGTIHFENISFGYKDKDKTLDEFNLSIEQGEKIALVGESGCGKTTLAYMLAGFYKQQSGIIWIDGEPLSRYSLESIHNNIGLVQQDVLIFDGTIRENIMLGNNKASETELIMACKASGVYDFVEKMEDGLDTKLGYNGRQLSGGQKQRLSIARIYLKNPSIIIFDEATSSLDSETEQKIHEAWAEVLKGRTSIVISHRQSAVMLCDKAALLKNGNIIEYGNPYELQEKSESFRTLFAIN